MSQITMFSENGVVHPSFMCGSCSAPIENDVSNSVLRWTRNGGSECWGSDAKILCGECDIRFPASENEDQNDLDTVIVQLLVASGVNIEQARKKMEALANLT